MWKNLLWTHRANSLDLQIPYGHALVATKTLALIMVRVPCLGIYPLRQHIFPLRQHIIIILEYLVQGSCCLW